MSAKDIFIISKLCDVWRPYNDIMVVSHHISIWTLPRSHNHSPDHMEMETSNYFPNCLTRWAALPSTGGRQLLHHFDSIVFIVIVIIKEIIAGVDLVQHQKVGAHWSLMQILM